MAKIQNFDSFGGCIFPYFCSDKREIWHGGAASFCQISRLSGQKCGNTAPKTVKISNFGHKFAPQGLFVCPICTKFSDFVPVSRWILSFLLWLLLGYKQPRYKHFPAVGAFSLKFSIGGLIITMKSYT